MLSVGLVLDRDEDLAIASASMSFSDWAISPKGLLLSLVDLEDGEANLDARHLILG